MRILNSKVRDNICNIFTAFDDEFLDNSEQYITKCFSVFDHWLSEKEAETQIFFYEHALAVLNSNESKQYFIYHDRLMEFYLSLFNKTIIYGHMYAQRGPSQLVEFDSLEEYKSHILASVREQLFLKIVLPEIGCVIYTGYDLTHIIYFKKEKIENFNIITKIIGENSLFILI